MSITKSRAPQRLDALLAIDPGKSVCYGARFKDIYCQSLAVFAVDFTGSARPLIDGYTRVVLEKPFIPPQGHKRPNDLIDLTASGFWVAAHVRAPLEWYLPGEWKLQRKKPIHHRAIWEDTLTDDERELFAVDFYDYIVDACKRYARTKKVTGYDRSATNHLDAVALGCLAVGRTHAGGRAK